MIKLLLFEILRGIGIILAFIILLCFFAFGCKATIEAVDNGAPGH